MAGHTTSGFAILGVDPVGLAGKFEGDVVINGTLTQTAGRLQIDHPDDPADRYLITRSCRATR